MDKKRTKCKLINIKYLQKTATYLSMNSNQVIIVQAQDYVNSMSVEQLVEFDQILAEKELDFIEIPEVKSEQPKVYTKTL